MDYHRVPLGTIVAVSSFIMTILSIPAGVFADQYGRKKLIILSLIILTISIFIVSPSNAKHIFIFGWTLFGIGRGLLVTPSFAAIMDVCKPEQRGKIMGIASGTIGAGSMLGYLISGILSNSYG